MLMQKELPTLKENVLNTFKCKSEQRKLQRDTVTLKKENSKSKGNIRKVGPKNLSWDPGSRTLRWDLKWDPHVRPLGATLR